MTRKKYGDLILNTEDELDWYRISFTFKVYPGETFENAHHKVLHSLGHFPYLIHSFQPIKRERVGPWNRLVEQTMDIGVYKGTKLEDLYEKFHNVTHLQQHKISEDQPIRTEKKPAQ